MSDGAQAPAGAEIRAGLAKLLPELRGFARFLVRDRTEADDLVQETIVRALASDGQFVAGTNLRAWLFIILRRLHLEQARRRRTERRALDEHGPQTESTGAPQDGQSALSELERMLWRLSPLLREALVLVGAKGLAYDEAAEICNVPPATMRARVSRARLALARAVGRDQQAPGAGDGVIAIS